jgi:hypothetical protein
VKENMAYEKIKETELGILNRDCESKKLMAREKDG